VQLTPNAGGPWSVSVELSIKIGHLKLIVKVVIRWLTIEKTHVKSARPSPEKLDFRKLTHYLPFVPLPERQYSAL
jgi:hypothetical protein